MQINSFPHQEFIHPAGVCLQVCASDPCDGADIHADLCFSFPQLWAPVTQGKGSSKQKGPRVCVHIMMASPLVYRLPAAKKAREETPKFGGAKSDTEKFGPLKVALGDIPTLCANHTVRSQSLLITVISRNFQETAAVGNRGPKPPLTYSCIGGLFRFASERRARAETPI